MKKLLIPSFLVGGAVLVLVAIISLAWCVSVYNSAASTKNLYEMKIKDNGSEFDNMWKLIAQSTQIADNKKDAFKEVYTGYASAATPQDAGKVMLWLKQAAPNLDLSIYDKAQNIIVSSRNGWTMRQKELVAIATTYNNMLVTFPRGPFLKLFGFEKVDPKVITSSRTERAFETGKDDDVSLTPKK